MDFNGQEWGMAPSHLCSLQGGVSPSEEPEIRNQSCCHHAVSQGSHLDRFNLWIQPYRYSLVNAAWQGDLGTLMWTLFARRGLCTFWFYMGALNWSCCTVSLIQNLCFFCRQEIASVIFVRLLVMQSCRFCGRISELYRPGTDMQK